MRDSETFGIEKGRGEEVIAWLNEHAKTQKLNLKQDYTAIPYQQKILEILKCSHGLEMFKLQEN